MSDKSKQWTSGEVVSALRSAFAAPEWMTAAEVSNATGAAASGRADFIAMNCYPSKGLEVWGFEVKVSRSDWLRELNGGGAKADAIARHCDRWSVVTPSGVVKDGELPSSWGHFLVRRGEAGTQARARKRPPLLEEGRVGSRIPMKRSFAASLLRAIQAQSVLDAREARGDVADALRMQGRRYAEEEARHRGCWCAREKRPYRADIGAQIREVEEAVGLRPGELLNLRKWRARASAAAFRAFYVEQVGTEQARASVDRLKRGLEAVHDLVGEALQAMDGATA